MGAEAGQGHEGAFWGLGNISIRVVLTRGQSQVETHQGAYLRFVSELLGDKIKLGSLL